MQGVFSFIGQKTFNVYIKKILMKSLLFIRIFFIELNRKTEILMFFGLHKVSKGLLNLRNLIK